MPPVNPPTPTSSNNISWVSQDSPNPEDPDIWFDAIDHVEMEETWFEGAEAFAPHGEHYTDPSSSAGEAADSRVPFTEDCRRGVQQLVRILGEYGESRMLSACLSKILPGTPVSLVIAANSLYTSVTERRNIDTAALHALGLASGYLPDNINIVSRLAAFIRDTVTGWTDATFLQQFLGNEENHSSSHLFTALAITAIVAGRWMKDEGAPQRGVLKVPAFMANIFIRASHYWTALGNMAGSLPSGAAIPENTGPSQHAPAFEVDTQMEMTGDVCDATASGTSAPRLTAFSSNSTARREAYTRATVHNRPAPAPGKNTRLSEPEQAHYLAVEKLRQESGLSDLLYCTNLKTETRQQTNEKIITNTYFNTKCDATVYPEPLRKAAESIPVQTDRPETQVSSAATGRSVGEPLLPLVITAAAAPVATSYIQALKSKPVIAAGAAVGLTGAALLGGGRYYVGRNNYDEDNSNILSPISTDYSPDDLTLCNSPQIASDRAAIPSEGLSAVECEYYLEINFIENVVTQPLDFISGYNKGNRIKRFTPIDNRYIPNLLIDITQNNTIEWRVRNEFDLIYRRAENSPDVRNATSSEERNIKLLLKVIQIVQQCIDHNKYSDVKYETFKSLSDILKELWDIADNLPDDYSKEAVKKYKEHFGSYRENISSTTEPHSSTDDSHGTKVSLTSSTENAANPHNEPVFIPLPEKRFIISPDLEIRLAQVDTASSVAPLNSKDDVKIEKMYDFSCIDERNNMSLADIIRQVGRTLRSPVQSLATESQVVHNHNTLSKGCPPEHESQHLLEVTGKIDAVLSLVMQLLPGANRVIVLQQIVGPALELFADELDDKPLDLQKAANINQQVLFLSQETISTLTAKDISRLYNKDPGTLDGGNITPQWKAFKSKGGDLYITIEGREYKTLYTKLGDTFFIEKDGKIERAYFVKNENRWKLFSQEENIHLSQLDLVENYGAKPSDSPWLEGAEFTLDKSNPEIMVAKNNGIISKYVIMNGYFIPVEEIQFDNEITTIAAVNSKSPNKKVLIQSEYGWEFERESTSVDKYLDLILSSTGDKGIDFSGDNKFTFIKGDLFSYNNDETPHVKYKSRYYEVNFVTPDIYSLKDAPGNYFIRSNGELKLRSSNDIIDFNDRFPAGVPNHDTTLYLEGVAYDDLIETGIQVPDAEPDIKVGPGVYVDKKHQFLFAANNKYFLLKRYTGKEIELESNIQGRNGVKLFKCGDTFLKKRKQQIPEIKYKEISGCRGVRSPTSSGAGCSSVWMEEGLVSIFNENIESKSNAKKNIIDSSIVNSNNEEFPNLFHSVNSGKLYYLHEGHYFNAEWVSTDEVNNPTSRPGLNIFTSGGLFRRKKILATILSEKKEGRIEIKTFSGFLHENVKVSKDIAQAYLENLKYQKMRNVKNIDGAIEELNRSGETRFPPINSFFTSDLDETTLQTYIKKEFYPSRIINDDRYIIKVIKPNDFEDHNLFSLRAGALKVRNHVRFIKDSMLPQVMRAIKKSNSNYNYYLGKVFKTDNAAFISGFMNEIHKRITRLNGNLVMDNIYVCDVYRKSVGGVNSQGELRFIEEKENLHPQERRGTFAFALSDKSKRIFISLDKLYFVDPSSPIPELRQDPETDLTTTLLHEASHLNGMTMDYVYFPREEGKIYPILDSIDSMEQDIKQQKLVDIKNFKKMSSDYVNSIPLLKQSLSNPLEMSQLSYLMSHDKAYLSHLLLNTADGIALLIQDLYTIAQTGKIIE